MTETLGIHLSADGISAAVSVDDPSRRPTVVELGASGPTAVSAVAAGADGAVLVGDAAIGADGPIVSDPLDRAVHGRTGALTAVITHVIGRAAFVAASGRSPNRIAIRCLSDERSVGHSAILWNCHDAGGWRARDWSSDKA